VVSRLSCGESVHVSSTRAIGHGFFNLSPVVGSEAAGSEPSNVSRLDWPCIGGRALVFSALDLWSAVDTRSGAGSPASKAIRRNAGAVQVEK